MRLRALAAVVPAALAVTGCGAAGPAGTPEFEGQKADVATVVTDLADAARRKDGLKICTELFSRALQRAARAPGSDCASEVQKATDDADEFDLRVTAVELLGTTARARVRAGAEGPLTDYTLVRENGSWRIGAIGSR